MSSCIVTRRCAASPLADSIIYDGAASMITVLSAPNRSDTLRIELQTPTSTEATEWAPPVPGSQFDARGPGGIAQRVRLIHRRTAALLSTYNFILGIEDRDMPRTLWSPNLARSAQGLRIGTSVICTHGAYVSAGSFPAWDTGSVRLVYSNVTGAFTVTPRVQLQAGDAVVPFDASEALALGSLSGAGAWRHAEHVLGQAGTATTCPSVITGREYYIRFLNNEAVNQVVTFDVYIDPVGIAR